MIKFLIDQGLPLSATSLLKKDGIDAVHTSEIGLAKSTDQDILHQAQKSKRTIVTLDGDFHMLMALSGFSFPSVIRIRIEGLKGNDLAEIIKDILSECKKSLEKGVLMTVQKHKVRVRQLPINAVL